jgi:hypothetical protein
MFCYLPGHKISKAMSVSHRMPYDQKNGVVKKKYFFLIIKKMGCYKKKWILNRFNKGISLVKRIKKTLKNAVIGDKWVMFFK